MINKISKKVLIIGSGGREHALGWKLKQSPKAGQIFFAPGNGGTSTVGENIPLDITDNKAIVDFAEKQKIDLVLVAPDDPLARGLVDDLLEAGINTFGPTKKAAEIEWSKAFAKKLMEEEGIPTAAYKTFKDYKLASKYLNKQSFPIVIKASGLALGKGAVICKTKKEAQAVLKNIMLEKIFGPAGDTVVIEEYLEGYELSFHAFCDGKTALVFPTSKDHKPIHDGNRGPNTGGMGTIAPVPWVSKKLIEEVKQKVIIPALGGLRKRGRTFRGCLYPGLMITKEGPKVLEFNARFGDPETQSYMRLLKTDLFDILTACADGTLSKLRIKWQKKFSCCIMLASAGYPGNYPKGKIIRGIKQAEKIKDVVVFHSGTKRQEKQLVTNGGRVLGVSTIGENLDQVLQKAYLAVKKIHFDGLQYRKDIGKF